MLLCIDHWHSWLDAVRRLERQEKQRTWGQVGCIGTVRTLLKAVKAACPILRPLRRFCGQSRAVLILPWDFLPRDLLLTLLGTEATFNVCLSK